MTIPELDQHVGRLRQYYLHSARKPPGPNVAEPSGLGTGARRPPVHSYPSSAASCLNRAVASDLFLYQILLSGCAASDVFADLHPGLCALVLQVIFEARTSISCFYGLPRTNVKSDIALRRPL